MGNKWAKISRLMPGRGEQVVKGRWRQLNRKQNRARNSSNNSIGDDEDGRERGGSWCGESLLLAMADGPVEVLTPREQETIQQQQREQRELLLQRELDQQMYYPGMLHMRTSHLSLYILILLALCFFVYSL